MAENTYTTKVGIDVETNIEPSIQKLKELKKELKATVAGSDDFKRVSKNIKDVEDALEEAKVGAKSFVDQLEEAPGPIGAIATGFRKLEIATKSFGAAFKAIGIGLIVSLVGGIAAAFSKSEEAVKKFEPLMIGLEKILNGVLEAIMPLIDGFIELATTALPYVSKAFSVVYSAVTAVFQSLGKLGGAVVKLFKGDFKGAWEDAKSSVTSFSTNYDTAVQRFETGTKKMTKTQKENLKEQKKDLKDHTDDTAKIREEELKKIIENEKEAALSLLDIREQEMRKIVDDYDEKINLAAKYGKDVIVLQEAREKALRELNAKFAQEDKEKADKDAEDKKKKYDEFTKFQTEQYEKINKLNQERQDAEFASNQAIGQSWVNLGNTIAGTIGSLTNVFEEGSTLAKAFGVAQVAISTAASIGNILLSGKDQQSQYDKAIAAGNSTIALAATTAFIPGMQGVAVAQGLAGKAAVTAGIAGKALSKKNTIAQVAAAGIAGATQIAAILSSKKTSSASAAGGGGGLASIPAPAIAGVAAPVIQGTQPMNTGTQIAQTLSGVTGKPVEAYVISGKVSSQQALDRRTSAAATFG
jgi:hypothetical protein